MKSLFPVVCALMLAGCAGINDRSYGTWLESVGRPPARGDMNAQTARELSAQVQVLRAEAEAIRISMAHEGDRVKRIEYMGRLQSIGDQLRPLQQALLQAGFAPPTQPPSPA